VKEGMCVKEGMGLLKNTLFALQPKVLQPWKAHAKELLQKKATPKKS
jgi:hypothetical protein